MTVKLDDGRSIAFDTKNYAHVDHGYAATIHKSQGVTVDRTHVLAKPGLDRHATYVALTRHREGVQVHYGRDDFDTGNALLRTLSRERSKDMASDYSLGRDVNPERSFAERRGISFRERVAEVVRKIVPEKARSIFANFRPPPETGIAKAIQAPSHNTADLSLSVEKYARSLTDIGRMQDKELPILPHQEVARDKALATLDKVQPHAARDIKSVFNRQPELIGEAANGKTTATLRAMQLEAEIRTNPQLRADRFVETWQKLYHERQHAYQHGTYEQHERITNRMGKMTGDIGRDAQLESPLRNRAKTLGIEMTMGRDISQDLANSIGFGRGRGLGLGR
jgi:hypothetical protein